MATNFDSYDKTVWVNDVTKLNSTNLNKIEQSIYDTRENSIANSVAISEILTALSQHFSISYANNALTLTLGDQSAESETPNINTVLSTTIDMSSCAKSDGDNAFTGNNTFGGSVTFTSAVVPSGSGVNLGSTEAKWSNVYVSGSISDGTNSISISQIVAKQDALTFDNSPTENSTNPVKSGGVYTALSGKQDALTFDNAPSNGSNNPVKSGGVYTALQGKADLDANGKIPASQLPSYVDDVVVISDALVNSSSDQLPLVHQSDIDAITTTSEFNSLFGTNILSSGEGFVNVLCYIYNGETEIFNTSHTKYLSDFKVLRFEKNNSSMSYLNSDILETGKIYVYLNKSYRIAGNTYNIDSDQNTEKWNDFIKISYDFPLMNLGELEGSTSLDFIDNGMNAGDSFMFIYDGRAYIGAVNFIEESSDVFTNIEIESLTDKNRFVYDDYETQGLPSLDQITIAQFLNPNGQYCDPYLLASDAYSSSLSASQNGTDLSLVTTGEKYAWNSKQDALPSVTNDRYLHTNATTGALEWSTVSGGMTNPMSAQGDIIYGGSSGTPTSLPKGTAGQLLAMNSGATAPEWKTVTLPPMGTAYGSYTVAIGTNSTAGASGQNYYAAAYGYYARAIANNATAIGHNATASGNVSIAIGTDAAANSLSAIAIGGIAEYQNAIAIGRSAGARNGSSPTAIGYNATAGASYSTALGAYAKTNIAYTVSIYGSSGTTEFSSTLLVKDPSHIFFANENSTDTTNGYTSLSQFASGKYLADYLMEANPTVPSGITPTPLTGFKAGLGSSSTYYSLGGSWGSITGTLADQTDLATALGGKQDTLTFDDAPTASSNNPVKSGGIYSALAGKADLVNGKVPSSQLPSYVDDVVLFDGTIKNIDSANVPIITEANLEAIDSPSDVETAFGFSLTGVGGYNFYALAFVYNGDTWSAGGHTLYYADLYVIRGTYSNMGSNPTVSIDFGNAKAIEESKIYIDPNSNKTYRASYIKANHQDDSTTSSVANGLVEISKSLALGMTSSTAYAGDQGAANRSRIESLETAVAGKQAALSTQTAYTSQGDATHVPQITTNSLGQVTGITEVAITQPTVNDSTLTITQNGVSAGTFSANASSNATIALTDTTYTAGSGIDITSGAISVDSSVVALQSDLPVGSTDVTINDSATVATTTTALENLVVGNSTDGYTKYTVTSARGTPSSGGTALSLVNTGDMYVWNSKQDALPVATNDHYLHANASTGALEWVAVTLPPMGTAHGSYAVAIGDTSQAGTSGYNYYSSAYGYNAQATGNNATAIGRASSAVGTGSTAIGNGSTAGSSSSTTLGYSSTASGSYSTALGAYAKTNIASTVSIYGYGSSDDRSSTLLVKDPSHIFFANQNASSTTNGYSSLSSFTSGKYLADYLVEPNPTIPSGTTPTPITGLKVGLGSSSTYYSLDGGSSIPTVTIESSQAVSQDPLQVQLTQAQYDIFANNKQVIIDLAAIGKPAVVWNYLSGGTSDSEISFGFPELSVSGGFHRIDIDTSTLVASYEQDWPIVYPGYIGSGDDADEGKFIAIDASGLAGLTEVKTVNGSSILGSGNIAIESVKTGTEGSATSVSLKFWQGTQQQYDAIVNKDANTLYIVKGSSSVSTISFQIQGVSYQAEPEMTWAQWCASAYNTGGFYIDQTDNRVYTSAGTQYLYNIWPTDTITANTVYILTGGGSN